MCACNENPFFWSLSLLLRSSILFHKESTLILMWTMQILSMCRKKACDSLIEQNEPEGIRNPEDKRKLKKKFRNATKIHK